MTAELARKMSSGSDSDEPRDFSGGACRIRLSIGALDDLRFATKMNVEAVLTTF